MLMSILLFAVGLVLLIKGGDWFVDGATGIAKRFNLPDIVVGATRSHGFHHRCPAGFRRYGLRQCHRLHHLQHCSDCCHFHRLQPRSRQHQVHEDPCDLLLPVCRPVLCCILHPWHLPPLDGLCDAVHLRCVYGHHRP